MLEKQRLHISETDFRYFMRSVPYPVVVITAAGKTEKRGFTVASFCSVSLEPVLVTFNVSRTSRMYGVIQEADTFAVHILTREQEALAVRFALPDLSEAEQFDGIQPAENEGDPPLINEVPGILICHIENRVRTGDHDIIVGRVEEIEMDTEDFNPLVYHNRRYTGID